MLSSTVRFILSKKTIEKSLHSRIRTDGLGIPVKLLQSPALTTELCEDIIVQLEYITIYVMTSYAHVQVC